MVTIYDIASADGVDYIAMELIRGRTLEVVCQQLAQNSARGNKVLAIAWKVKTVGASNFFGSQGGFEAPPQDFAAIKARAPHMDLARSDGKMRGAGGPRERVGHDGILMHAMGRCDDGVRWR